MTLNLRTAEGRDLLRRLVAISDVVTENFSAGAMAKLGFSYDELRAIKPDIVYVSNCGFGHVGPYADFKTFGPIVQAVCGLTFGVGAPDAPPASWGFSYMDHMGANLMAVAVLAALAHRNRTGEGQWVDMSCTDAGLGLTGPDLLDYTVNDRPLRRPGMPDSNHSDHPPMAPHGIYPTDEEDRWVAIACRDDHDWTSFGTVCTEAWVADPRYATIAGRVAGQADLDAARRGVDVDAQPVRDRVESACRGCSGGCGGDVGGSHRPRSRQRGMGNVPRCASLGDRRRARRRPSRAPLGHRLARRARRAAARRAQPSGVLRPARRDGRRVRRARGIGCAVSGALDGVRVVEVASQWGAWAGKLLGDLGADVVIVEPPGGHETRGFGPVRR